MTAVQGQGFDIAIPRLEKDARTCGDLNYGGVDFVQRGRVPHPTTGGRNANPKAD
jgi:hypothetical protein